MSDVQTAIRIGDALVQSEYRGDLDRAMWDVERKHGVPYGWLWQARYRKKYMKDIKLSVWRALLAAHETACERQRQRYEHELKVTRALQAGTDSNLVRAAVALAGPAVGEDEAEA